MKIVLLGGGELGKEFAIEAKRLGLQVFVIDNYHNPPAAQVADKSYVCDMLNGEKLQTLIESLDVDIIVPEIEAIDTKILYSLEEKGKQVVPSAKAVNMTMNRDEIRNRASELGLKTAKFSYAENCEEYISKIKKYEYPFVVKPIMSSSGKGQTIVQDVEESSYAWHYAMDNARGKSKKVIIEEFIDFDYELTLLAIKTNDSIKMCYPIVHYQEKGDYQWSVQKQSDEINALLPKLHHMASIIVNDLGGNGLFGVEFFVKDGEVIFSELSPRPHDTGMVTMISQNTNEFELHLRAILGLPINKEDLETKGGASKVILSKIESISPEIVGLKDALSIPKTKVRIFGKTAKIGRRMGVVLAPTLDEAIEAESKISIIDSSI